MKRIAIVLFGLVLILGLGISCDNASETVATAVKDNANNNTMNLIYEVPFEVFETISFPAEKNHVYILEKELFFEPFILDFSSCAENMEKITVAIYTNYANESFMGQIPIMKNDQGWISSYELEGVYYAQIMTTADCELQISFI